MAAVHFIQGVWNEHQSKCQRDESGGGNKRRSAPAFNSNSQKGRNQNGSNKKPRYIQNFKPENRTYSKEEWGSMSNQHRLEVIKFRKSKLAANGNQARSTARKIVSSIASKTVSLSSESAQDDMSDAASQFGRKICNK